MFETEFIRSAKALHELSVDARSRGPDVEYSSFLEFEKAFRAGCYVCLGVMSLSRIRSKQCSVEFFKGWPLVPTRPRQPTEVGRLGHRADALFAEKGNIETLAQKLCADNVFVEAQIVSDHNLRLLDIRCQGFENDLQGTSLGQRFGR